LGDMVPYGFSKALVNAYAMHVAREHPDVTINACTPGMIDTDLSRAAAEKMGKTVEEFGAKPPEHGAVCPVYLMLDELPTPRGQAWFYGSDSLRSPMHKCVLSPIITTTTLRHHHHHCNHHHHHCNPPPPPP
jgi:carbonyl reductase 1